MMVMITNLIILMLITSSAIFTQTALENLRDFSIKEYRSVFKSIQEIDRQDLNAQNKQNDLVIGQTDPNEVVSITGSYFLDGNLIILNNGVLNLEEADFQIDGDITILGKGQLNVNGGKFTVIQEYIYEHQALVLEGGSIRFSGVQFHSSGQSWSNGFADSSQYILENSEISEGFITTALLGKSTAHIANTQLPGEFLCLGKNNIEFQNCDILIMWLVLPETSVVNTSLPDDSLLVHWHFSNVEPNVSGIPYSATIDSCTNVNWGLISISGSDATFHNSKVRAAGLLFQEPDSIVVRNLTNGSTYMDEVVDVPDRTLHLVNSEVTTWNFYPSANSNVTIENCIFGELISQDRSNVLIDNSLCDGTGGYLGAFHESFLVVFRSLINTQVISRNSGILVGALSAFMGSEIDADETSGMAILNTATFVEPEAHQAAVIFEGQLPPVEGLIDSQVPIWGTARILAGPMNPIQFGGYSVEYSENLDGPTWLPTDGLHPKQVINDTLVHWNTAGLVPGIYGLRLNLFHNLGEPISLGSSASLDINTKVAELQDNSPTYFSLQQNYPNPFNPVTVIRYQLPKQTHVSLKVFDILGKEVTTLVDDIQNPGEHQIEFEGKNLAAGIYYYRLEAGDFLHTRPMLLVK